MALDNIPTLGPGGFNGNLDKVLVHKNGGSEVACSLLTLTNSALNPAGLYLDPVNQRVGIGTTAPIAPLNVYNSSASVSSLVLVEQDTSATVGQIINYRKNGSVNLTYGTEIGRLAFGGYFNSTYSPPSQTCSAIYGYYGGTGTDRVGGLRLVTWNGGGLTTRLQVAPDGKIGIGTTIAAAKLEILGDGSTSATTSLLVQNSSGNNQYRITDDGTHYFSYNGNPRLTIENSASTFGQEVLFTNKIYFQTSNRFEIDYDSANNIGTFKTNNGGMTNAMTITSLGSVRVGIGQGIISADTSSVLELKSTTLGFLKPRLTTAEKNLIASPAAGLEVYDTDLNRPCFFNGTSWITL